MWEILEINYSLWLLWIEHAVQKFSERWTYVRYEGVRISFCFTYISVMKTRHPHLSWVALLPSYSVEFRELFILAKTWHLHMLSWLSPCTPLTLLTRFSLSVKAAQMQMSPLCILKWTSELQDGPWCKKNSASKDGEVLE